MATKHTLTITELATLAGIPYAKNIRAYVVTNLPKGEALIDTTTNEIMAGGLAITLLNGSGSVSLPATNATDLNVVANTVQYEVRAEYVDPATRGRETWRSGYFALTGDANLADVATDASPMAVESASAYAAEAEAARDDAVAITGISTTDAAVSTLVNTGTGPLTQAALGKKFAKVITPQAYGAVGDGTTNDTTAFQNALDAAAAAGAELFIPKGQYKITAPLQLNFTPSTGRFGGIRGEGYQTAIVGYSIASGRAVLELLGTSHTNSVQATVSNFRILMDASSNSGSYCLRAGDARDGLLLDRLWLDGANCLSLRVASSTSYAQINTTLRNVVCHTNYAGLWFNAANDPATNTEAVYAVSCLGSDWGGAQWDNVLFESCAFNGLVDPKAFVATFHNCQFFTNPNRPTTGGIDYAANVAIRIGGTYSFRSCYFEDHRTAVVIAPGISDIGSVSFESCRFSGVTNYTGGSARRPQRAIEVADLGNGYRIGSVRIDGCDFGDHPTNGYQLAAVRNAGADLFRITGARNWQSPATKVRVTYDRASNLGTFSVREVLGNADFIYGQDDVILVDTFSVANCTLTVDPTGLTPGKVYTVKDKAGAAATKNITIDPNPNEIDWAGTKVINTNYGSVRFVSDGTRLWIV